MNNTTQKTKLDNIVHGDIIDTLKDMKSESSSNEEAMFNNNLSVVPSDTQKTITVSDSIINEDDYVEVYKKSNRKYLLMIFLEIVITPILFSLFYMLKVLGVTHGGIISLIFAAIITLLVILCPCALIISLIERDSFQKPIRELAKRKNEEYIEEVQDKRLSLMSGFNHPRIIKNYDDSFFVLRKIYTDLSSGNNEKHFYSEGDFSPNVLREFLSCGVLAKVQFNDKDSWTPENEKIVKYIDDYGYDKPAYVVTNNAINVFIVDDGITEEIFDSLNKNENHAIPKSILVKNDAMDHSVNVLTLMGVLDQRHIKDISESIVSFGPRYKSYIEYMESRS